MISPPSRTSRRLVAGLATTALAGGLLAATPVLQAQPAQAATCLTCEPGDGDPLPRTTTTTAAPNTPPTATMSWTRDRRAGGANATSDLNALANYVTSLFKVYLNGCGSQAGSSAITSYRWNVNGALFSGCSVTWSVGVQGNFPVSLTVTDSAGRQATTSQTVTVKDRWVVTLGDSIASGEGNPAVTQQTDWLGTVTRPVSWPNTRCHRSTQAASQQAMAAWENAHPQESVTFVNLGCSGAKLVNVVQGRFNGQPYKGIQPDGVNEPPQLDVLEYLRDASHRLPDAVYLSAGANDLGFADIAKQCASLSSWTSSTPQCAQLDPAVKDGDNLLVGYRGSYTDTPTNFAYGRYAAVANGLAAAGIPNSRVQTSQYPDPTKKDDGGWCPNILGDTPLGLGRINEVDVRWAGAPVTGPVSVLNNDVAYAAAVNGWKLVPNIVSDYQTHGYCASGKWIVNYSESPTNQGDQNGTLHPNTAGTADYATRIRQGMVNSGLLPA